jgi:hypothetical protein
MLLEPRIRFILALPFWLAAAGACAHAPSTPPPAAPRAPGDDLAAPLAELRAALERDDFELVVRRSAELLTTALIRQRPVDISTIELLAIRGWALWHRDQRKEAGQTWLEANSQWKVAGLAPSNAIAEAWAGLACVATWAATTNRRSPWSARSSMCASTHNPLIL